MPSKATKKPPLGVQAPCGGCVGICGIGGTQQTVASATEVAAATGFDVCLDLHVLFLELANPDLKLSFRNAYNGLAAPNAAAASLNTCLDFHGRLLGLFSQFVSASLGH